MSRNIFSPFNIKNLVVVADEEAKSVVGLDDPDQSTNLK